MFTGVACAITLTYMDITGIDLFDQNVGMACAEDKLFMDISGVDVYI